MGDYHTRRDADYSVETIYKLGTADDWRYVRRSEVLAIEAIDAGKGTNVRAALAEPSIVYRFPWPGEDNATVEDIQKRDMFHTWHFGVPIGLARMLVDHRERIVYVSAGSGSYGGYGVNVWVPCPAREDFALRSSNIGSIPVGIVGERYTDGVGRTIFECGYCAAMFSADEAMMVELRQACINHNYDTAAERFLVSRSVPVVA